MRKVQVVFRDLYTTAFVVIQLPTFYIQEDISTLSQTPFSEISYKITTESLSLSINRGWEEMYLNVTVINHMVYIFMEQPAWSSTILQLY